MKKLILTLMIFWAGTLISFAQTADPIELKIETYCPVCCTPAPVTIQGQIIPTDQESATAIRLGRERVNIQEIKKNVQQIALVNRFGYFTANVTSCDYLAVSPFLANRASNKYDIYTPPNSLIFMDEGVNYYYFSYEMFILTQ